MLITINQKSPFTCLLGVMHSVAQKVLCNLYSGTLSPKRERQFTVQPETLQTRRPAVEMDVAFSVDDV